jgi:hypothetical protein
MLLAALTAACFGQTRGGTSASLQLLSGGDYIADHGYLDASGKLKAVDISPDLLSPRFQYSGPTRFEIRPLSGPGSKRDDGPPLAWYDLPSGPGPHRLILLVNPRPGSNGISAVNDEPGALPFGSIRFLNLCPHPVELQGERLRVTVKARGSAVIRPDVKDGQYFDLDVVGGTAEDRRTAHLRHFHMVDARNLIFIEPEGENGEIRLKGVEERATKAEAPNVATPPPKQS